MYIQNCIIPVTLDLGNRIRLPKILGAGSKLDFFMFMKKRTRKLYLVPNLLIGNFQSKHKTIQILGPVTQDNHRRIIIPKHLISFLPLSRSFWFQAKNDVIEICKNIA